MMNSSEATTEREGERAPSQLRTDVDALIKRMEKGGCNRGAQRIHFCVDPGVPIIVARLLRGRVFRDFVGVGLGTPESGAAPVALL